MPKKGYQIYKSILDMGISARFIQKVTTINYYAYNRRKTGEVRTEFLDSQYDSLVALYEALSKLSDSL
jgi:hypothetical protein